MAEVSSPFRRNESKSLRCTYPLCLPTTHLTHQGNVRVPQSGRVDTTNPQSRAGTQEDQDETDEKARKKAMNELVASWMDRLQLISVIVRQVPDSTPF